MRPSGAIARGPHRFPDLPNRCGDKRRRCERPAQKDYLCLGRDGGLFVGVTVAKDKGFFEKHGLDVELVNYSGSTDQLLETLATGKADAAIGMALRWLKPLEQGFDVKIVAGGHGGCFVFLRLHPPVWAI